MAYDYKEHFGEITLTQDLTTLPEERTWRLAAQRRYSSLATTRCPLRRAEPRS